MAHSLCQALCYTFLERRVEGANAVGMLVSKACETGNKDGKKNFCCFCKFERAKSLQSTPSAGTQLKSLCVEDWAGELGAGGTGLPLACVA